MFMYEALLRRAKSQSPIRVGLIGAGKFGSMFLAQVPSTPGLEVVAIADLFPDQAKATCASIGWSKELIAQTSFSGHISGCTSITIKSDKRRGYFSKSARLVSSL